MIGLPNFALRCHQGKKRCPNIQEENDNRLIKQVKSSLFNTYKVDWSSKARNSIKLRTYIKFKFDLSLEEYLFRRRIYQFLRCSAVSHSARWYIMS